MQKKPGTYDARLLLFYFFFDVCFILLVFLLFFSCEYILSHALIDRFRNCS